MSKPSDGNRPYQHALARRHLWEGTHTVTEESQVGVCERCVRFRWPGVSRLADLVRFVCRCWLIGVDWCVHIGCLRLIVVSRLAGLS
jgi:hypothetical protein